MYKEIEKIVRGTLCVLIADTPSLRAAALCVPVDVRKQLPTIYSIWYLTLAYIRFAHNATLPTGTHLALSGPLSGIFTLVPNT